MRHNPSKFCSNQYLLKKINSSKQTEILDRKYVWIAHVEDHFTKLHIIWAQETKTMEETTEMFERYVLAYFGLSTILHTDNGQEQANGTLETMIAKMQAQTKEEQWHKLISKIQFNLNTQESSGIFLLAIFFLFTHFSHISFYIFYISFLFSTH